MALELDHLVIVAASLDQGVAWCEQVLGITPGPGGQHPRMGTHNRLFSIHSPAAPGAYAEIIAIDPEAMPPHHPRWFAMDTTALQAAVAQEPRLVHAVLRSDALDTDSALWRQHGLDPGRIIDMHRLTEHGPLNWRLTVRDDGTLPHQGTVPTLIEWPQDSPGWRMPPLRRSIAADAAGPADQQRLGNRLASHTTPLPAIGTVRRTQRNVACPAVHPQRPHSPDRLSISTPP